MAAPGHGRGERSGPKSLTRWRNLALIAATGAYGDAILLEDANDLIEWSCLVHPSSRRVVLPHKWVGELIEESYRTSNEGLW